MGGSSFLFDSQITGPAISHLAQVPPVFWILLTIGIGAAEQKRLVTGWVDPADVPVDQPGLLKEGYTPGDIGFDPLGFCPDIQQNSKFYKRKNYRMDVLLCLLLQDFGARAREWQRYFRKSWHLSKRLLKFTKKSIKCRITTLS